jgi:HAD superfamily hydrolase (TIGR01549 family)
MAHDAWLVDLDGTLYRALPVKLAMGAELSIFGWRVAGILRKFRRAHETLRHEAPSKSRDPYRAQIEHTARQVGRPPEDVLRVVTDWMQERPGKYLRQFQRTALIAEIREFRAKGGKTALVSDYPASRKLEALGAADLFDAVVASGEVGGPSKLKPDPEGYLLAASRLGVSPARCLVIGDREDADGAAASAAHMEFRLVK